ncbi:MAG: TetR/AcrR family transcriptional regulator [Spirochaetes bacterium]|nr:TetR/AcrR family transcriptional regulator [Spirochaetota bacterium]
MASNRESVKKKILLATINFIERKGIESVTTRNVAGEAGVNIAAINYYFGTKELLLKETFKITLDHFSRDLETIMSYKDLNVFSLLKVFLIFILQGSLQYPNIMKILLFDNSYSAQYSKEFMEIFNSFIKRAIALIVSSSKENDERIVRISLMQMISAVLTPGSMILFTKGMFEIDLEEREEQLFYVDYLLQHYLTWMKRKDIDRETGTVNGILEEIFNSPGMVLK